MRCPTLSDLPAPPPGRAGWPWTEESPQLPDTMPDGSPWPRISIVTPSYNQRDFIQETLRSVLLQGYPNLEYGVIDGGSTDGSVEIIRRYAPWLAYWVSERDGGQSAAINKGWARATGDVLAYLNSDDLYEPGALLRVAVARTSRPSAGLWHGRCLEFDEMAVRRMLGEPYAMFTALTQGYDAGGRVAQPAAFVSRQALQRVGMLDVRLKQSMDKDLWQRVAALYEVAFLPEVLARFRVHAQQLSQCHARDAGFSIAKERRIALENLFALEGLSADVRQQKRRVLAKANLRLAQEYRFAGRPYLALCSLLRSCFSPTWITSRAGVRSLGVILAGSGAASLASTVKRKFL